MGVEKSMKENDNDLAIVCFLQALRCRDIKCLQNEPFSIFFTLPNLACLKSELSHAWACGAGWALQLLRLLYSFGALLPPDVFVEDVDDGSHVDDQSMLKAQASFVANGEKAYRDAIDSLIPPTRTRSMHVKQPCFSTWDAISLMSSAYGVAQGSTPDLTLRDVIEMNSEVKSIYDRSIDIFKDAISVSPLHGPAWCGLGCSLSATDPLLAQHALCTALTLDKMMPDSWSNLAFLYAEKEMLKVQRCLMD
jgi:hypothetical protein